MKRTQPQIPNKLFFKIGEVCELAGLEAYVLRFWESEFPNLAPQKRKTGQRVQKLYKVIKEVYDARFVRVPTKDLNALLREETLGRGGLPADVKIKYIAQVKTDPPTFVMFSN